MGNIIKEALWMPVRDYKESLFIFWPLILFNILLLIWAVVMGGMGLKVTPLVNYVIVGVTIYFSLLSVSGLINWHRKLILGGPIESIKLLPGMREITYLGIMIIAGILVGIIMLIIIYLSSLILGGAFFSGQSVGQIRGNPGLPVAVLLLSLVAYMFAIAVLARVFMILPRIAIDADAQGWTEELSRKFSITGPCTKALVAVHFLALIPVVIVVFLSVLSAKTVFSLPVSLLSILANIYAPLAFASIMSMLFRDHVLPTYRNNTDS